MDLRFHLMVAISHKIGFQLKLLPRMTYDQTISKARKLHLIFWKNAEQVSHVDTSDLRDWRLNKLEEAISQVSARLVSLGTRSDVATSSRYFKAVGQDTWHGTVGLHPHGTLCVSDVVV